MANTLPVWWVEYKLMLILWMIEMLSDCKRWRTIFPYCSCFNEACLGKDARIKLNLRYPIFPGVREISISDCASNKCWRIAGVSIVRILKKYGHVIVKKPCFGRHTLHESGFFFCTVNFDDIGVFANWGVPQWLRVYNHCLPLIAVIPSI